MARLTARRAAANVLDVRAMLEDAGEHAGNNLVHGQLIKPRQAPFSGSVVALLRNPRQYVSIPIGHQHADRFDFSFSPACTHPSGGLIGLTSCPQVWGRSSQPIMDRLIATTVIAPSLRFPPQSSHVSEKERKKKRRQASPATSE